VTSVLEPEVAVVGAGPAGMAAALAAAEGGADVLLIDREHRLGGQLVKQTHKFFGSSDQEAGIRGIHIAERLGERIRQHAAIRIWLGTTVIAYYPDGVLLAEKAGHGLVKAKPRCLVVATGAAERHLAFAGNDLPGVYGAGAVQTLMNVHGVLPGQRALMVGAGNIGLIVSYQLLQAGVQVVEVIEAAEEIGGYAVHAAKIRRAGVPIRTRHSVLKVEGDSCVEQAVVARLDEGWKPIPGTERVLQVDLVCLAVGLTPLTEILWQAGCRMVWVPELGGHVPVRSETLETTVPGVWVAGDAAGVEEASTAMIEGELAGLAAAHRLRPLKEFDERCRQLRQALAELRAGPLAAKVRRGLARLEGGTC